MAEFRRVQYMRTDLHYEDEPREGSLLTFLYDIPYFPPCGVFPPIHLLNQFLSKGSCGGGMSPGVTWEPFAVTPEEYAQLVEALASTPLEEIKPHARYAWHKPVFDHELDGFANYIGWMAAAIVKHRDRYHKEMQARSKKESA